MSNARLEEGIVRQLTRCSSAGRLSDSKYQKQDDENEKDGRNVEGSELHSNSDTSDLHKKALLSPELALL